MRNVSLEPSNQKFFRIKKFESLAFLELVNHFCLGEDECRHPFEQNSDQKFQNKVYPLFFKQTFLNTRVVTFEIFVFKQNPFNQATNALSIYNANTLDNFHGRFRNNQSDTLDDKPINFIRYQSSSIFAGVYLSKHTLYEQ